MDTAPPRALSIRQDEPSFRADAIVTGSKLDILIGQRRLTKVIAYDCDAGWSRRYETDHDDRVILNAARDDAMEEVVSGDINVRWRLA